MHCTALHCTALHCTALHYIILHYTKLCYTSAVNCRCMKWLTLSCPSPGQRPYQWWWTLNCKPVMVISNTALYDTQQYSLVWNCKLLLRAERRAWAARHPLHQMRGCMFHFTQNLWKHINRAGFSTLYSQNSPQGKTFKGDYWCNSCPWW